MFGSTLSQFTCTLYRMFVYFYYCFVYVYKLVCHVDIYTHTNIYTTSFRFWVSNFSYIWTNWKIFFCYNRWSLFDEKSLNQLYIRLCVQIFKLLFCLLFKLLLKFILFNNSGIVFTAHIEVYSDISDNEDF